ncbi:MAG: hypothetical protein IKG84_06935 [Bacteroidales bacterium]|nr:hypothetical protein [Bacteroidales bacterium]
MINADDEVSLAYLLDPTFQLVNTAGKPLTDGWLEVYIHGTRNKYYCYKDWDKEFLHPFKIPLDSLGANIVLASPAHAYDVYVYNKFGSLVMSRYNVVPATGDGAVIKDVVTITSEDGTVDVNTSDQTNWDLSIKDTVDRIDDQDIVITELGTSIDAINEDLGNKKDKQSLRIYGGSDHMTITKISQNENGEITEVKYEPIDLPPEVPNVEITSPNGTIDVQSSTDVETNTKTFTIDVNGQEPVWHYWTGNNAWTVVNTASWTQINRPSVGAGSTGHSWNSEIKRGVYDAKSHFTVTFHNADNEKVIPNQLIQVGFRAKFVGKNDPTAINYVDLGSWTYDPTLYTTEPYQYNFAQESLRQNHDTSNIINVASYWGDTDFDVFFEARLLNTDGGVGTPQPIDTVLYAEITYFGYHEIKGTVTGSGSGIEYNFNSPLHELGGNVTLGYDDPLVEIDDNLHLVMSYPFTVTHHALDILRGGAIGLDANGLCVNVNPSSGIDIVDNALVVKVGDGLAIDPGSGVIVIDSDVSDVVETVEKLKKDLDTQLTVNFDMPNVDNVYDFANPSVIGNLSDGAVMLCQAFTVPINHDIRVDDGITENPTLLGIYAKQPFSGKKIMLALYVYDFDTGYTDYVGDTGPVSVSQGRNEFPLLHINPNISELKSSCVYYASLYLPSNAHSNGLWLAGCPSYSNASYINAIPRFTIGVQNISHNGSEIDMTDATTGRLDFNDGEGNYYIGPWSDNYNERPSIPRFFMQIRNGEAEEPIILTPFENITYQSIIRNTNAVANNIFSTGSMGSASSPIVFQELTPNTDVDIVSCTMYDGIASEVFGNNFAYFSSNFGTRYDVQSTVVDAGASYGYSHTYTFTSPVHLTAGTTYRWPVSVGNNDYFFALRTYDSSVTKTKVLHLFASIYDVSQWVNFSRVNNGPAVALTLVDSNNNTWSV